MLYKDFLIGKIEKKAVDILVFPTVENPAFFYD